MNKVESSILLSTYNNEDKIISSIKSILKQTYVDFELLIIDDGSTDSTRELLNGIQKKDSRIKIFSNQKNLGLTRSLNILINESNGELIFRQDADDISLPNRLQNQVAILKDGKYDVCFTRAIISGSLKKIPNLSYLLPYKLVMKYKNPFIHGTMGITRDAIMSVDKYDEKYYFAQDYHLYRKIINSNFKIYKLFETHYVLNMKDNISSKYKEEQNQQFNEIKKLNFK